MTEFARGQSKTLRLEGKAVHQWRSLGPILGQLKN